MGGHRSSLLMLFLGCFVALTANITEAQSENSISTVNLYVAQNGSDSNPGTYEKPLATLLTAQQKVQKLIAAGLKSNVIVNIRAGTYELDEPLIFGPADSGTTQYSITYSAYPRERVYISGGRKITGWKEINSNLWAAPIDKNIHFEQLYINDERAIRARTPNVDSTPQRWHLEKADYKMPDDNGPPTSLSITLAEGQLEKWSHAKDIQVVIFKDWATFRKQVSKINPSKYQVTLQGPFVSPPTGATRNNSLLATERQKLYTCYFEGSPDMIDAPGEWAINHDKSRLEYLPRNGEMLDDVDIVRPQVTRLLVISGTSQKSVQNIHFRDLRFAYSKYDLPERGHDGRQAVEFYTGGWNIPAEERILPAAIEWRFAQNCSLCGCKLSHTGANGIALLEGCQENLIEGNRIYDTAGNCIMLGTDYDPGVTSPILVRVNIVRNNWIHSGGRDYPSAVGLWLGFARSCAVSHNRIQDLPYTGISVGWQWNDHPSSSANNRIEYNYIFDVMKELGDGGAIYTLGYQPKTVLRGNHIHNVERSQLNEAAPNNGFFFDEGSRGYLVDRNLVYNISSSPLRGHKAMGVKITNNILVYDRNNPVLTYSPPSNSLKTNGTIRTNGLPVMVLEENDIFSDRAWRLISEEKSQQFRKISGLEREFRKILME